jgi:hypothetical protein
MMTPENGYPQYSPIEPGTQNPIVTLSPEQTLSYMAGGVIAAERERKRHRDMTVCIGLDLADCLAGWVPFVGQLIDIISAIACILMFGPRGFFVLLEMIDFTGIAGAVVPTCTLVAKSYWKEH